jgi:hypothetical protein
MNASKEGMTKQKGYQKKANLCTTWRITLLKLEVGKKNHFENTNFPYKNLTRKNEHIYPISTIKKINVNKYKMLNGLKKNHVTFQIEEIHLWKKINLHLVEGHYLFVSWCKSNNEIFLKIYFSPIYAQLIRCMSLPCI